MDIRRRFQARGSDGKDHEILVLVSPRDVTHIRDHAPLFIDSTPELRTASTGQRVNRLAQGRYQIVQTGEILESSDPDAF
jgi:hypothetical protein